MNDADTGIYMENETLGNFARNTAAALEPEGSIRASAVAADIMSVLRSLRGRLRNLPRGGRSEAEEWFSDNWYLAEREGKDAAACFHGSYPKCAKRACVSEAAAALVRSGRGEVTGERIRLFLSEYSQTRPLTERELSVFVPALKAELCAFLSAAFQSPDAALLMKNVFTSLRALSIIDVSDILEEVNPVEAELRADPSGVYPKMDEDTRRSYRDRLAREAKRAGMSEHEAAKLVIKLSREEKNGHVGTYIFTRPLGKERREPEGGWYISTVVLTSLFLGVLTGILTGSIPAALLSLVPISEAVKNLLDFFALRLVRPKRLPRLELSGGIPPKGKTVCVISALLTGEKDGPKFANLLEEYRLLNRDAGENLLFGILADLKEAPTQRVKEDGPILESARAAVEALNKKYSGGFYLFCRERELNKADNIWMGRERKRGAIEDLVELLSGSKSALRVAEGDEKRLSGTGFILTLDADTRLTAGAARELVGAALHPLNVPTVDERERRVVSGYGIFEPRVSVDLRAAGRSDFSRIFAGEGGTDPYSSVVSDLYQDLFSEGTFMGKGLINVPVYKKLLSGALPDNRVLSHDILEGAYMRCAYVSDVELTDGWPYKVTSFLSRQERWTRGDWQNLRWCTRRVKNRDGALVVNTLPSLDRWKLFDNLRRSLLPVTVLLSLLLALVTASPAMAAAGLIALAGKLSGLLISAAASFLRHDGTNRARYHSAIVSGFGGAVMRSLIGLALLPAEGWMSLKAIITAVYRMTVTRRGLLAWVTSSEAERRAGNTLKANYLSLIACPLAGLFTVLAAPSPSAAAVGVVWLLTPAYACVLSREISREKRVSPSDRSYLLARAGEIWRFFADNLTENDNFLPPDNLQEEPNLGPAHRTSPTNIGLAMLSCAAASDLGLVGEREASELVKRTLTTVEKLEKWNGQLFNWYDTRSLLPLEPRYVSTVDSGNLMGALIALESWFTELNDAQSAERCRLLLEATDLRPLFDTRRKLFRIGWDLTKNAPSEGWYDLLASEARQTSYIAAALGQVPRKHWRRLGRALVSMDGFSGMASWTGTMFEYLMPNLLLPCPEDSLIYESSRFCLYAQKRAGSGVPWGISESAYYAFDPGLSYRYKAHGVQRLALKRGMDSERVVSPYSSYLALPLDPAGAVKNLRRLDALGVTGTYGHFEAADFTPSRAEPPKPRIVRSFMAHHLGMSLVAVANTLCGGIFQKRFMADRRMAAYRELLEERVPLGQIVLRQPPRDVPEKPRRQESSEICRSIEGVDAITPACLPLSNGQYSVLFTEAGSSRSLWRGLDVTAFSPDPLGDTGMEFYVKIGEELLPITASPDYPRDVRYSSQLSDVSGKIRAKCGGVSACLSVTVPPSGAGEVRTVEVEGPADVSEAAVICRFKPVLQRREDYLSHPAFSLLSLEAELSGGILTVRRRPRPGEREVYLAVAADTRFTAATHRRRGDGVERGELLTSCPDFSVTLTLPVRLTGGRGRAAVAFSTSFDREEARGCAKRAAERREVQSVSRMAAAALMLGMSSSRVRAALGLLPALIYGTAPSEERRGLLKSGGIPREELWSLGVSGTVPILAARPETAEDLEGVRALIREHAFLSENGVESDLLLILTDGGDYRKSQRAAVTEELRAIGREGTLDAPGGVRLIDAGGRAARVAEAHADVWVRLDAIPAVPAHRERMPEPPPKYVRGSGEPAVRLEENGAFRFAVTDALPETAWSHILTNDSFGFIATDCGTGHMWYKNSRLGKINRWLNDPYATVGCERLTLTAEGKKYSLFADGTGAPTLVEYGFGWASWSRELGRVRTRLTAFVPPKVPARVLLLEAEGDLAGAELGYYTGLILGETGGGARAIVTAFDGRAFTARPARGETFTLIPSVAPAAWTMRRASAITGELDGSVGPGEEPCIAFTAPVSQRTVIVCGCAQNGALEGILRDAEGLLDRTKSHWGALAGALTLKTPEQRIDSFLNGWALYQTVACRLLARTGVYQNGGATGFRDQLQDASCIMLVRPDLTRRQLKAAASRQYAEGDVMHWWHDTPEGPVGVRTHCSDDLLWLPWALCGYVERTGDMSVCRERVPYLASEPLGEGERDRYERPGVSSEDDTVFGHAKRAAWEFMRRGTGEHSLALMLGGDWNDGMDGVGREGRGESVWLTFFGAMTLRSLAELCRRQGDSEFEGRCERYSRDLMRAAEGAWAGDRYLRGYYDDGTPLGAPGTGECEIDSISQSFALFAGADRARAKTALSSAVSHLRDGKNRLTKLFDPPFDRGKTDPGYIRSYAPGFRENGGQYTHAAVWLAGALLESGQTELGAELLAELSPWGRDAKTYCAEPYVIAADVSSAPGLEGRAGWSWYTGSAGWYFKTVTETLLGLKMRGGRLFVEPKMPERMYPARVKYTLNGETLDIELYPEGVLINGAPVPKDGIKLRLPGTEPAQT